MVHFNLNFDGFYTFEIPEIKTFHHFDFECKMKITAIIVTYNRPDALEVILNSILMQNQLPYEVIIADDGSGEETAQLISKYEKDFPCRLKHVWQEDKGFRAAKIRNKAIKESTGEYLFFSDGDLFFHSRFFHDLRRNIRPGLAVIGSRVFLKEEATTEILQNQKAKNISCFSAKIEKNRLNGVRIPAASKLFQTKPFSEKLRGGLLCVPKKNVLDINGWNEDFTGWGKEDTEIVARLCFYGTKIKKLKFAAITYHLWHPHLSRKRIEMNEILLSDCLENKKNWCKNGLVKGEKI